MTKRETMLRRLSIVSALFCDFLVSEDKIYALVVKGCPRSEITAVEVHIAFNNSYKAVGLKTVFSDRRINIVGQSVWSLSHRRFGSAEHTAQYSFYFFLEVIHGHSEKIIKKADSRRPSANHLIKEYTGRSKYDNLFYALS